MNYDCDVAAYYCDSESEVHESRMATLARMIRNKKSPAERLLVCEVCEDAEEEDTETTTEEECND